MLLAELELLDNCSANPASASGNRDDDHADSFLCEKSAKPIIVMFIRRFRLLQSEVIPSERSFAYRQREGDRDASALP